MTQEEFNRMLAIAISQGLPGGYYKSKYSGERIDTLLDKVETPPVQENIIGKNLLDNWYFVNPVNQRGKAEYTAVGYMIDRWMLAKLSTATSVGEVRVTGNGLVLNNLGVPGPVYIRQIFDQVSIPNGTTVTFSVLVDETDFSGSWFINKYGGASSQLTPGVNSITFKWNNKPGVANSVQVYSGDISEQQIITVVAAKLELGPVQTLAHKENGKWVLNEIPDYGTELAKCQRRFIRELDGVAFKTPGTTILTVSMNFPVTMEKAPSFDRNTVLFNAFGVKPGQTIPVMDPIETRPSSVLYVNPTDSGYFEDGKTYGIRLYNISAEE